MARVFAIVLLGVVIGAGVPRDLSSRRNQGKDAFLAKQGEWFDKYVSRDYGVVASCAKGVVLSGIVFGGYELLALVIYAVIKPRGKVGAA